MGCCLRAFAKGAEQAMPPGLTLEPGGQTPASESDRERCALLNAETPVALGAERSPTRLKGGIARTPGAPKRWDRRA